jgi:3-deoxy-D-manno-octulosonic-acid transferase
LLTQQAIPFVRYSDGGKVRRDAQVILVDELGVLLNCYGASDVAFVGGSLSAIGGHNVLEPAALAKPIIVGPSLHNVVAMADALRATNALDVVQDAQGLSERVLFLISHPLEAEQMGQRAYDALQLNRGALSSLEKALDLIGQ